MLGACAPVPAPEPAPAPSSAHPAFANPVHDANFPDPEVVADETSGYWALGTNGGGSNVQTLHSDDLTSWEQGPDALPQLPRWTRPGKVWAPEVAPRAGGGSALYYTSAGPDGTVQCVGVATGKEVEGPYTDHSRRPLVCQEDRGGSIDAHPFVAADGKRYLYWKNDGNAVGQDTYLWVAPLTAGGTRLAGEPQRLLRQDLPWEGRLIEAPFVWEQDGRFHLFYSGNAYDSEDYAVGHAVADSPLGPFHKDDEPVLATDAVSAGPGHCAVFAVHGRTWMAYHAWSPGEIGGDVPGRSLWLSEVTFAPDGGVTVVPPTVSYPTKP